MHLVLFDRPFVPLRGTKGLSKRTRCIGTDMAPTDTQVMGALFLE